MLLGLFGFLQNTGHRDQSCRVRGSGGLGIRFLGSVFRV